MKSKFRGWYPITPHERGALSRNALFSLDSNVLLNLYGVEEATRDAVMRILRELARRGRLWLTHQAVKEFQTIRPAKILEQLAPCAQLRKNLENSLKTVEKALQ